MALVRKLVILLLCWCMLASCAALRPEPPDVQLAALEITDLSLTHANFLATLKLFNPNGVALDIEGLDFTLYLNDIHVASGRTAKAFVIPAEEFGEAALRLSSSYLNLFRLSHSLEGRTELDFRISGSVDVGGIGIIGMSIPIEHEGALPLSGSLNQLAPDSFRVFPSPDFMPPEERIFYK